MDEHLADEIARDVERRPVVERSAEVFTAGSRRGARGGAETGHRALSRADDLRIAILDHRLDDRQRGQHRRRGPRASAMSARIRTIRILHVHA